MPRVAVIINPISGAGAHGDAGRRRVDLAAAILTDAGRDHDIVVTEHVGHAADLTRAVVARGASAVSVWGGDGTINEVVSVLAFGDVPLGIIPAGSGNGLARDLGLPFDPADALRSTLDGTLRTIDVGELGGRLFANVAGIGFDALIAARFAERAAGRRGFGPYLVIALREFGSYKAATYTIATEDRTWRHSGLMVAFANSRQYGNGAVIAPHARLDDGRLDLVAVGDLSIWAALRRLPRLFDGTVDRVSGVTTVPFERLSITADAPMLFHVDGEVGRGPSTLTACVHPRALKILVPARAEGRVGG